MSGKAKGRGLYIRAMAPILNVALLSMILTVAYAMGYFAIPYELLRGGLGYYAVDSKQLEHGWRNTYAGFASFCWYGVGGR